MLTDPIEDTKGLTPKSDDMIENTRKLVFGFCDCIVI